MAYPVFQALQASALAQAVAKSNHLVGAGLQIVHITGLLLLLAGVLLIDLRALGLVLRGQSLRTLGAETSRVLWLGLGLAAASGALIFLTSAVRYAGNGAFELKIALLLAAIGVQYLVQRRVFAREDGNPAAVRSAAILSLVLWFGVAAAGRAIGYI
jgi:hypothetical protein